MTLKSTSLWVLAVAIAIFVAGIPPFDHVLSHYYYKVHPVARQLKIVYDVSTIHLAAAVGTAMNLGVFDSLRNHTYKTARELAEELQVPERGLRPLLAVLAAGDYLYTKDDEYTNGPVAEHHLVSGLPDDKDMTNFVRLLTSGASAGMITSLPQAVQNGGSVLDSHAEVDSNPFWEIFADVTAPMMKSMAKDLSKMVKKHKPVKILDIASGSGAWGFAMNRAIPTATVTLNDYANVLEHTKKNAAKDQDLDQSRLQYLPGNVFDVPIESNYFDVILAPNIIHHFSPETTITFLKLVHGALKPGGFLYVAEICEPTQPYSVWEGYMPMTRTFSQNMLIWTRQGKAYSVLELKDMLLSAGFVDNHHAGDSFPFACFVVGRKPE